jgi:hypothetical protein
VAGVPESLVAVSEVAVNAPTPGDVVEIVGVCESETLQYTEMGFDEVKPERLSGCPDGSDAELLQQTSKGGVVMGLMKVIHDHEQPLSRVAGPQTAEGVEEIRQAFVLAEDAAEMVAVDIVEAEKLFSTFQAAIGGAAAHGPLLPRPGHAALRAQFERAPFVKADYRRRFRAAAIELPDAFFFTVEVGVL